MNIPTLFKSEQDFTRWLASVIMDWTLYDSEEPADEDAFIAICKTKRYDTVALIHMDGGVYTWQGDDAFPPIEWEPLRDFSDAAMIIDVLRSRGWWCRMETRCCFDGDADFAGFFPHYEYVEKEQYTALTPGNSIPVAICLAAYKVAVTWKKQ